MADDTRLRMIPGALYFVIGAGISPAGTIENRITVPGHRKAPKTGTGAARLLPGHIAVFSRFLL